MFFQFMTRKRILQIHAAITFGLFLLLMVGKFEAYPLLIDAISFTWFLILVLRIRRRTFVVKIMTALIWCVIGLVLCSLFILLLDARLEAFGLITIWLMLTGAVIPFLMFFSLFVLYCIYPRDRKRNGEQGVFT